MAESGSARPKGEFVGDDDTRLRRKVMIGIVIAVVGLAVPLFQLWQMTWPPQPIWSDCRGDLRPLDDECVGVTDGSHVFDPALATVQEKIAAENAEIEDGPPHVSVALMMPLSAVPDSNTTIERLRSQVEGAYVAQRAANDAGANPPIRLLLANKGSREQASAQVARKLVEMKGEPEHLVAVIGLGLSSEATAEAARILSDAGIPMVGAVITADPLNTEGKGIGGPIPGLTRVNLSVAEQFAIIADHLRRDRPDLESAVVVGDSNPHDLYTTSMRENFTAEGAPLARYWQAGGRVIQPYDGTPGTPGINAQFSAIVSNFCGVSPPDMVFYAGRASLLPDFVQRLRRRTCLRDRTITVVTGSDASVLGTRPLRAAELDAPVSVIYVPLADPVTLNSEENPDLAQYRRFAQAFVQRNGFPEKDLADGWALMTHDAMLAATTAIARVTGESDFIPRSEDIRGMLYALNSPTTAIPGAAGTFRFDPLTGDVQGRRAQVLELGPDGRLRRVGGNGQR